MPSRPACVSLRLWRVIFRVIARGIESPALELKWKNGPSMGLAIPYFAFIVQYGPGP
jgi:hypothetical protein